MFLTDTEIRERLNIIESKGKEMNGRKKPALTQIIEIICRGSDRRSRYAPVAPQAAAARQNVTVPA